MKAGWVAVAGITGLLAVGAGAFGAHGLKSRLGGDSLAIFETAVRYQMYHALALLGVAWVGSARPSRVVTAAGVSMIAGMVLFCGSLYGFALLSWRWLGPITPIGGIALMGGWLLLVIAACRRPSPPGSGEA